MRRALTIAACLTAAGACRAPQPPPPRPSILLVTLDATRADRLGAYGYALATTPTWDALAEQGTLFRRAYSASPLTLPSHATLMTGLTPPSHGVRDDGGYVLGDDVVTLAERFSDAGYTTAAFTASFSTHPTWGLHQGFQVSHASLPERPDRRARSDGRRADQVVDDAISTLTEAGDAPLFVWVHLFDAHWPYDPPEPHASAHEGRPYDAEVAFVDAEAARLLAWWDRNRPDGVVAVTADHGEALGDGGEQTHGILLHDATLRVPLILRGPGVDVGAEIVEPVGLVDVAPTLLALAGLPGHPELQGRDLRDSGARLVYSEAPTGQHHLGLAGLYAYTDVTGRYTEGAWGAFYPAEGDVVTATPAPPPERGGPDLTARADTLGRLRGELPERVAPSAALDAEMLEMMASLGYIGGDRAAEPGEVDPRDVIEALGMLREARHFMAMGLYGRAHDVVDRLSARMPGRWGVDLLRAQLLHRQGRLDDAIVAYADLYHRSPNATVALHLASLTGTLGRWEEAEIWSKRALERAPHAAPAMAGLLRAVSAQGRQEEADALAHDWVASQPDRSDGALIRAELLLGWSQLDAAGAEAMRALEVLPWSPWAHELAGRVQWERGAADAAIERMQDALALSPYDAAIRVRLARWLLEGGRNAEAVRMVAPLTRLLPGDPAVTALYDLAREAVLNERRGVPVTPVPDDLPELPGGR